MSLTSVVALVGWPRPCGSDLPRQSCLWHSRQGSSSQEACSGFRGGTSRQTGERMARHGAALLVDSGCPGPDDRGAELRRVARRLDGARNRLDREHDPGGAGMQDLPAQPARGARPERRVRRAAARRRRIAGPHSAGPRAGAGVVNITLSLHVLVACGWLSVALLVSQHLRDVPWSRRAWPLSSRSGWPSCSVLSTRGIWERSPLSDCSWPSPSPSSR